MFNMSDKGEECELTNLINSDNECSLAWKTNEASPLITPSICKVLATPSTPTSNKASSGGGSIQDAIIGSHGSFSSRNRSQGALITPSGTQSSGSRFLYINEKANNLSRRPSLLSDVGCRTPKDVKTSTRLPSLKKGGNPGGAHAREAVGPTTPPNTPSPSNWRHSKGSDISEMKSELDLLNLDSQHASESSSELTTKALASGSEDVSEVNTSSETLRRHDKAPRPLLNLDLNPPIAHFNTPVHYFGSSTALNFSDHLNYLEATRSGHTGLRSVGSNTFLKSFWGSKQQRNVQHHCFMSDITDVRQMEQALLQLLEDFQSGKLRAFAKDCSMEQMQGIREQQERLARLHFDLGAQQELFAPLSDEGLRANQENMQRLMSSLQELSMSIEKLQLFSKDASQ